MADVREVTLSVPEIDCQHCVMTINSTLGKLPGVEQVNTDLDSKTVFLRYDPAQVTMETVEDRLDDAGYTVAK